MADNLRDPFDLNRLNKAAGNFHDQIFGDDEQSKSGFGKLFGFQQRAMRDIWDLLSWDFIKNNWGKMFVMFFVTLALCMVAPGIACYLFGLLIGANAVWHWIAIVAICLMVSGWWLFVPWYVLVVVKISYPILKFWAKLPDKEKESESTDED